MENHLVKGLKKTLWPRKSKLSFLDSNFSNPLKIVLLKLNNTASGFKYCSREFNMSKVKVIIHQPDQFPTFFHDHHTVDINGTVNALFVSMKIQKSSENLRVLSPHVRKCYFEDERKLKYFKRYTQQYCILECMHRKHQCDVFEIPRARKVNRTFCPSNWYTEPYKEIDYDDKDDCKCYQNCNYMKFTLKKEILEPNAGFENVTQILFQLEAEKYSFHFIEETERFLAYTITNCKLGFRFWIFNDLSLNFQLLLTSADTWDCSSAVRCFQSWKFCSTFLSSFLTYEKSQQTTKMNHIRRIQNQFRKRLKKSS